ncbi:radical SAM/SPASM domain-containing protein [Erysipelothrix urinaevulpis]|uniref:radical SAM/SPASM domain-containing protein n=1 Tax=Erysipelothrix urinaevulpis TaxID=2683717 RepID=UPI001357003D|nr:radical SAM protein [Erysipelothrix urinaevulpis]
MNKLKDVTVLIKPSSSSCDNVCSYCFYDDVSQCRKVKSYGLMDDETRKNIIKNTLKDKTLEHVNFAFQGGEPTLIGIDYYYSFIEEVNKENHNAEITYAIQTNGVSLNEEWLNFFKKHNFLVGISIDGYKENHDKHRFFHRKGSFDHVYASLKLIQKYELDYNVLTVLTKNLANNPDKLFDFYLENNLSNIQIIECLPDFNQTVYESPFACTPELYDSFYKQFYKRWYEQLELGNYMSISLFDDCIRLMNQRMPITCGRYGGCKPQAVIEADGKCYPCDFYVMDGFETGKLHEEELSEILQPSRYYSFIKRPQTTMSQCKQCPYFNWLCHGGCPRMKETFINEKQCSYQRLLQLFIDNKKAINQQMTLIYNKGR